MNIPFSHDLQILLGAILTLLVVATITGFLFARLAKSEKALATGANLNARMRAWWIMVAVVFLALLAGPRGLIILFAVISFLAFREFVTLTPTRRADHRTLFWAFFVVIPLQYLLIDAQWYGLFCLMIPVYAVLLVAILGTLRGDPHDYLARTAKIQWGLLICVYCLSHVPALLQLEISRFEGRSVNLLLFLLVVTEMNDVLQYVWGKLLGRHKITPHVSPNKTWEGFIGGTLSAVGVGVALRWMTPFSLAQAAGMALIVALMGFAGGVVMSAVKRDAGVKDFGTILSGHGGILDRIDSLAFAAPVFFHVVRFYFTAGAAIPQVFNQS